MRSNPQVFCPFRHFGGQGPACWQVKLAQQAKLSGLDPAEQPQGPPWSFELSSSSGNSSIFVVKQMSPSFQHQEGVLIGASNFSSALEEGKLINATESPSKLVSATAKAVLERFGAWNATELTRLFALLLEMHMVTGGPVCCATAGLADSLTSLPSPGLSNLDGSCQDLSDLLGLCPSFPEASLARCVWGSWPPQPLLEVDGAAAKKGVR
ncbi:unnamed protein product, partial [Effrenium voratum]